MSLLVQKKHKIGNDSGLVSVIARIENNQIIPVVDDEFSPENTVFITNSYTQSIDSRFSDDDLFILDNYRKIQSMVCLQKRQNIFGLFQNMYPC